METQEKIVKEEMDTKVKDKTKKKTISKDKPQGVDMSRLSRWAELLLDTGKRNNLVNFKDTKSSTVEVVFPDFKTLFDKASSANVFEVFDPKIEDDEDKIILEAMAGAKGEIEANPKTKGSRKSLTRAEYIQTYSKKMKKVSQILLYNAFINPIKAIKEIHKRAGIAIEETGVNIAYMAFGFINWKENDDQNTILKAPILLVPIAFENIGVADLYSIRIMEDDIIVNPTFEFKLLNDYDVKLPDYDDQGIEAYLAKVKSLISKYKWTISTECKISTFSFLKINMYRDVIDNAEKILKNDNVRALLGECVETPQMPKSKEIKDGDGQSDLLDLRNVVDADSSQAEAIELAKNGRSFVLQGPPGTGKSQTITNIIAECLHVGKKVLFVSEKLAALNVVYEKLKQAGLDEFCLELHSHKVNKKDVIEELCKTLRMGKSALSSRAAAETALKKKNQEQLDIYAEELHKIIPVINKSLYQLFEQASLCRNVSDKGFTLDGIDKKGEKYISEMVSLLEQYVGYVPTIGYDYRNNPWFGYTNLDTSYQTRLKTKIDFENYEMLLKQVKALSDQLRSDYKIECSNVYVARHYAQFFSLAKNSGAITPGLLVKPALKKIIEVSQSLKEVSEKMLEIKAAIDADFGGEIYEIDGADYHNKYVEQFENPITRLVNKEYKRISEELNKICKNSKKLKYEATVETLKALQTFQEYTREFDSIASPFVDSFGKAYNGYETDWKQVLDDFSKAEKLLEAGVKCGTLIKLTKEVWAEKRQEFDKISRKFNEIFKRCSESLAKIDSDFNAKDFNVMRESLPSSIKKCAECIANLDKLDNWCRFVKLLGQIKGLDNKNYIDFAIENKIPTENLITAYKKVFYTEWVDYVVHGSEVFSKFSRIAQDRAVELFAKKDELQFEINKAEIKAELSANRPNMEYIAPGSAISILTREGEKKRKQKSVRVLLAEIGNLVQLLKPCFLMSPLSVSTFLNSDQIEFDVVIFDEASQIFPQDAIVAVYRGKQLIVVGDSKQMPPSNFFNEINDDETGGDDEGAEDITDFESILDLCSTILPQLRLKWHYRSRYEPLISFSNKNFYNNDLVTFPSSKQDKKGTGVDYYFADGVFDNRSRTNLKEAEFVVDLIFKNAEVYPERSLGVVAFSITQQELIERLLAKKRQKDLSREKFFRSDAREPFFIKNLETVQGDERDTIIFSTAYAKNLQGKLLHNFGPLNRDGGERRLNVAITRAKHNVQLVSSMHNADIELARTKSAGARLLKEYLDYAENRTLALENRKNTTATPFEQHDLGFESEVCEFLRENGFVVDAKLGCSSFKIDMAVKMPNKNDYAMAIECDGETYRASKNARDRDRLRQSVLERMGWRFYRIWSTDWYKNKRIEKERLLQAVNDSIKNFSSKVAADVSTKEISFELKAKQKSFTFNKYILADIPKLYKKNSCNLQATLKEVLAIEAPLAEEWLLRRISYIFGKDKVTATVRGEYEKQMVRCEKEGIIRKDGFLYLEGGGEVKLRVHNDEWARDINFISLEELADGILSLLKLNISAEKNGLYRALMQQLGGSRIGDASFERLEKALQLLSGTVETNGEMMSLVANC